MHATKHWSQNLYKVAFNFRAQYAKNEVHRGATIGGKTGKTVDLPKFCKIDHGGALPCYRGLT